MQDKIIAAIAAYLEKETTVKYGFLKLPERLEFNHSIQPGQLICRDIATEIAAAIAPLVEENDLPLSELFTHMSEQHDLTLTDTELADIIQVSRGK